MFFSSPFNFPFFYNNYRPKNHYIHKQSNSSNTRNISNLNSTNSKKFIQFNEGENKKDSENILESSESFFEIFGLKLHLDDILIICILLFLYNEKVHDDELFICLILLIFS